MSGHLRPLLGSPSEDVYENFQVDVDTCEGVSFLLVSQYGPSGVVIWIQNFSICSESGIRYGFQQVGGGGCNGGH